MKSKILAISMVFVLCFTAGSFNNAYGVTNQFDKNEINQLKKVKYDMVTGNIKEIITNEEKESLLIEDAKGNEYVFHINEHTIVITFEDLKVGDKVDIIFNGILTKSIPPQGNAMIIDGLKISS